MGPCANDRLSRVEELHFRNPKFGFHFLRLSTGRLFENIDRLERRLADGSSNVSGMPAAVAT